MRIVKGVLLKPVLNLLNRMLKHTGNSLIIGGPLGWSWQATLDAAHHGSLAGPANAHRHSDLANIGIDDHHARDHASRHVNGGADAVSLAASQVTSGRFATARMPDGASGYVLTAQGTGADPAYAALPLKHYTADETEKSVTGTTETEVKSFRMIKSTTHGMSFATIYFVGEARVAAGTGYLRVSIDGGASSVVWTFTSTSYAIQKGSLSVSWSNDTVHTISVRLNNSGANATYNRTLEVYVA